MLNSTMVDDVASTCCIRFTLAGTLVYTAEYLRISQSLIAFALVNGAFSSRQMNFNPPF